jgi:hypothetical protein
VDLDGVIDPLYDLVPGDFVPARDAAAKAARADGDRATGDEIAALRRPTVVAWLANQLSRRREDEMAQFLELGASLREATAALSGPELRELSRQRQALVSAMVREARAIARELTGSKVTEDVARGLEETLLAALADPDAAQEVRLGRLSTGLEQSGFSTGSGASRTPARKAAPVRPGPKRDRVASESPAESPSESPAGRPSGAKQATTRKTAAKKAGDQPGDDAAARRKAAAEKAAQEAARRREQQRGELEQQLGEAWAAARRAAEVRDGAIGTATQARDVRREAERRLRDLEAQLRAAREAIDAAEDAERAARDERDRTETVAEQARKVVTDLQARLDAL